MCLSGAAKLLLRNPENRPHRAVSIANTLGWKPGVFKAFRVKPAQILSMLSGRVGRDQTPESFWSRETPTAVESGLKFAGL